MTDKKVKVYYNLHKNCYSIVSLEKENYGKVIKYSNDVPLIDVQFKVSEKLRQKVLKEKRKNVHAYVVGTLVNDFELNTPIRVATYNPYKYSSFVDASSKKPLDKAKQVLLSKRHFVDNDFKKVHFNASQIYYVA
tara:strand:+ start:1151 stop:1555 length:405 start_codon:yes stop_codon:yes gene_type:complete